MITENKMTGGHKILSATNKLKQTVNEALRDEAIDAATYSNILIHVSQITTRITQHINSAEREHTKQGGSFYARQGRKHE